MTVKISQKSAGATRACRRGKSAPANFGGGQKDQLIHQCSREQQNTLLLLLNLPLLLLLNKLLMPGRLALVMLNKLVLLNKLLLPDKLLLGMPSLPPP